jgi:hypothetical protein
MSDTPRTNNAALSGDGTTVPADFAADLERELATAKAEVERLREVAGQALAFTLRGFSTVRDFDAARTVMHDALRAVLKETK